MRELNKILFQNKLNMNRPCRQGRYMNFFFERKTSSLSLLLCSFITKGIEPRNDKQNKDVHTH